MNNSSVRESDQGSLVPELLQAHRARVHFREGDLLRLDADSLLLNLKVLGMHQPPQQLRVVPLRDPLLHAGLQEGCQVLKLDTGGSVEQNSHQINLE